jgi:hypothetical protein
MQGRQNIELQNLPAKTRQKRLLPNAPESLREHHGEVWLLEKGFKVFLERIFK